MALTPADILGPTGRIAARLERYESRPQQIAMAEAVFDALGSRRHLIVEAGTGVGKSFAYLVPAILATACENPPRQADRDFDPHDFACRNNWSTRTCPC